MQIKFLNSVIVDLRSQNAELQQQLDSLTLSTDDADLYEFDISQDLKWVYTTHPFEQSREVLFVKPDDIVNESSAQLTSRSETASATVCQSVNVICE